MRRTAYILFALAALLWTGCNEYTDPLPGDTAGREIAFSCVEAGTRAEEITSETLRMFRVSAKWNKPSGGSVNDYMDGQLVERHSGEWIYSPICYMPSQGTVDFFAYSPVNDPGLKELQFTDDFVLVQYEMPTHPAKQKDFVVALTLGQTSSIIPLEFLHTFASVRVEARSSGSAINIETIKLSGVNSEGWLMGDFSAEPESRWSWETLGTPSDYTLFDGKPITVTNVGYTPITDPNIVGPLLIIPQVNDNITLQVTHSNGSKIFTLDSDFTFEMGQKYVFQITL
ncbi:fimbrillin family protein [Parabacteroides sp. OttesenSCG-928-O15]|nr:fimbrillin family protein [Parabacteroides sp. OttesenSCG-928-O15]